MSVLQKGISVPIVLIVQRRWDNGFKVHVDGSIRGRTPVLANSISVPSLVSSNVVMAVP